ncbi:DUF3168 domain-containing protein [Herminiimonas sp. CN]|uniref:DUF3168 domain-containing protein n=1 Tax=Herminiimonas sp. CN TaxID=1349818 RepID=UPI0004741B0E|nr:DUF3168 domain-containing protein [Herminiimonas sp. CN]
MSIETSISAALSALVAGRVYPAGSVPATPTAPYIVYQSITDRPENTLSSGVIKRNKRVQIDGYAGTYAAMKTLETGIQAAMPSIGTELMTQNLYEPDTKLNRTLQEYSCWY